MSVTDGDREKAASIVGSMSPWRDLLAAALAEEREKARAPFLALADEFDAESAGASIRAEAMDRTDENVRHHTAERRHARVAMHHAALIRRAAEAS